MTNSNNLISASAVMEVRARTGAPMMDCKRALQETQGNIEDAIVVMRKKGQAKADKKADRIASEGIVETAVSETGKKAVIVEINCETDFVARDENFIDYCNRTVNTALANEISTVAALSDATLKGKDFSVEQARKELVVKIGENIQIRRMKEIQTDGIIGCYRHGSRIGVLVSVKNGTPELAKNIAMHIAASKPLVIKSSEVSQDIIQNEREIFMAQAKESGKPQAIIDKMIDGRIEKFLQEISLLDQPFVKNPDIRVAQLLKEHNAEVLDFVRFEVGEGIEKREGNFAEEVMAQVRDK